MVYVIADTFRSIEVENLEGETVRVNEGDMITFATEDGVAVTGKVTKLSGKKDKVKVQIVPPNTNREEIYSVVVMVEGSLRIME